MKKIILGFLAMVMLGNVMAQDKPKTSSKRKADVSQKEQSAPKQNAPGVSGAPAPSSPMKKDGTPDMRHKANKADMAKKDQAAPAGPTKKDGTPDMRHKANKKAAADKK